MATLEPMAGAVRHIGVELGKDVVVLGEEFRVIEETAPVGRAADDRDRVAVASPRRAIDQVEQAARARVPRPMEVVGEAPQTFEPRREGKAGRRDRRDANRVHERASYRETRTGEPV